MATASAIIAFVGMVASNRNARKARQQQRRARLLDVKRAKLQSGRAAAEQVRQAQIARASILQQAENQGASDSTAVAGAAGAVQSQAGGNIAFAQSIFSLQNSASRLRESASASMGRASGFQQLSGIGMQAFNMSGGFNSTPSASGTDGSGTVMNPNFQGIGS